MLVSFKRSLCLGLRLFELLPGWLTKAVLKSTQSAYLRSYSCRIVKIAYGLKLRDRKHLVHPKLE